MPLKKLSKKAKKNWSGIRRFVLEHWLSKTFQLAELESYAANNAIPNRILAPAAKMQGPSPIFLRSDDLCDISDYSGTALSPEIRLIELENVTVIGRTEFIIKDNLALYPRIIVPSEDAFMMELENRGSIQLDRRAIRIFPRAKQLHVNKAISLLGQCNGNYAHWVTEVLARFVMIDDIPEFKGLPLLVDCPVHEKLLDALDFLNVSRREIIDVLPYQRVKADHLVYITPPSMTPPETRTFFETGQLAAPKFEQFHFSTEALAKLRDRAVGMARDCLIAPKTESPWFEPPARKTRKLFLRREAWSTGNGRLLRNADDAGRALEELGFEGINIADYSFEGQILTAADSGIIVSAIGAAITNFVFREPGCIVIILSPHYAGATFYYFANLMAALGHQLIFVLGPQTRHGPGSIYNKDFRISVRLLRQAVRKAIEIAHEKKVTFS